MIGKTVSHYRIIEKLGEGGMGVVYKAEDTKLKRTVALKFLPPELTRDPEAKARFVHEAQAAAALSHQNICTIHEIDEFEGQSFIAMECYEGETLKERIARGPLPLEQVIDITQQIVQGLAKAHEQDIVHRDVKPANIFITHDGLVKVVDFGLAKLAGQTRLTRTGTTLGTVAYMSPEQARGDVADHRTDLWSLGVVLFEMLTQRLPFRGEAEPAVVYSILNEAPEPVTNLSKEVSVQLEELVEKALTKDPQHRYQSADELLRELAEQRELLGAGLGSRRFLALRRFRRNRQAFYGTLAGLVMALTAAAVLVFHSQSMAINSIAVLPFENLSGDPDQEYFADGMTRELTVTLGQISGWSKVISSRSMMKYKETDKSPRDIASEMSVKALLSGSVQRLASGQVKAIVELVDGGTEKLLWTQAFECELSNLKNLQNDITRAIAARVDIELTPTEEARLASAHPVNPAAYELYLKARHQFYEKFTKESCEKAIAYLQKAIEIDPDYAQAYAWLAGNYIHLGWYVDLPLDETSAKIIAYTNKALEIDDTISEAHWALARTSFYMEWEWERAEEQFKRAIDLNPSSVEAHGDYTWLLMAMGRFEEAIAQAKRFLQLDPVSWLPNTTMAFTYYCARQYDQAIAQYLQMAEMEPDDPRPHTGLAMVYEQMGRYENAVRARQKRMTLSGAAPEEVEEVAALGRAYRESGSEGYWMWHLEKWKGQYDRNPAYIAMYYGQLGDKDQAFAWLEKAYERHDGPLFRLKVEPGWDPLRDDPRFQDLLRRMKFPEDGT